MFQYGSLSRYNFNVDVNLLMQLEVGCVSVSARVETSEKHKKLSL